MKKSMTASLAECSLMLALAVILSLITVYQLPYGGSITLFSMVPILYVSFFYPLRWAALTAAAFVLLQMLFAFYPPPAQGIGMFAAVVMLDYLLAFGVLGFAGCFGRLLQGVKRLLIGGSLALIGRFLCHFVSGIFVWGALAPEGQPVALYSFLYNGSFMLGEWLLTMAALAALHKLPIKKGGLP
ncbi:MAG: energy-coupled thiamine transporter ThiT [Clostridia bacterium]|nr:energy-coupled thiamine transporter ThiT [Clostridia bacterium]